MDLTAENIRSIKRHSDAVMAAAVVFILVLLIMPITGVMLDSMISVSIFLSITTLLMTLYTDDVLSFNTFPSFLLILTLYRLGLNIASTRMILTEAQAGEIIKTFGEVVTGGNQFVGFVIFLLLTGINFVVITKGSGRVAEVAARFTLDSLPGKQLSIEADLNSGLIDEQEARSRREKMMEEADFYGAMDGASKFVRGDAIAAIAITFVNLIGGFIIGMIMRGMTWDQTVNTYITLSVGDGLVTQIPALLVSVGAGIIVTRTSTKENLGVSFRRQLFNNVKVLFITSTILLFMGFIPGMPLYIMAPISFAIYFFAWKLYKARETTIVDEELEKSIQSDSENSGLENILLVEPIQVNFGKNIKGGRGENLIKMVSQLRRNIAKDLGMVVPSIPFLENPKIDPNSYVILFKGSEIFEGKCENISEIGIHLDEIIRKYAHEIINRQEVSRIVDNARQYATAVIDEIIPKKLTLGQLLKVLQNLLKEQLSIRDISTILETIADHSQKTTDPNVLSECVRQGLSRYISQQYTNPENHLIEAITIDSKVEKMLLENIQDNEFGKTLIIPSKMKEKLFEQIDMSMSNHSVILTVAALRPHFKKFIERDYPHLPVLSTSEIIPEVKIKTLGTLTTDVLRM